MFWATEKLTVALSRNTERVFGVAMEKAVGFLE